MVNKLLILILFTFSITACNGTKIEFTEPKMEKFAEGTIAEGVTAPTNNQTGVLIRPMVNDGTDKISMNGRTYQVGKYSSAGAYSFIQSKPLGSQTNIRLSGNTGKDKGYAPNAESVIDVITIETIFAQ